MTSQSSRMQNTFRGGMQTDPIPSNQVLVINKGNIFNELERLKGLDNHRMKLEQIQRKDPRTSVKKVVDRFDPAKHEANRLKRNEINAQSK